MNRLYQRTYYCMSKPLFKRIQRHIRRSILKPLAFNGAQDLVYHLKVKLVIYDKVMKATRNPKFSQDSS